MRGYRRYWPLRCRGIDTETLSKQRGQLFAEAVAAYRAGESYHVMPKDTTGEEQRARTTDDPWTEDVLTYCAQREMAGHSVRPAKILVDSAIEMERSRLDHTSKLRVVNILKAHGWIQRTINNERVWVKPRARDLGD
jgi:putative DNA primase/helicase